MDANTNMTGIQSAPPAVAAVPAAPETITANANPKRLSDAIATVLRTNGGQAMGATEIAKAIVTRGLWPEGKSKDLSKATWNALALEIQQKGAASRFVKVEGGKKGKYTIKN